MDENKILKWVDSVINGLPVFLENMNQIKSLNLKDSDYKGKSNELDDHVKDKMKIILKDVQSGKFAKEFVNEIKNGSPEFNRLRKEGSKHLIEKTGKELRDMMSWMKESKLVDEEIK